MLDAQDGWRKFLPFAWFLILLGASFTLYDKYQRIGVCHALQVKQDGIEAQADTQTAELEDVLKKIRR